MFSFSTVLICPCIEFSYIKAAYMFLLKKKIIILCSVTQARSIVVLCVCVLLFVFVLIYMVLCVCMCVKHHLFINVFSIPLKGEIDMCFVHDDDKEI